MGGVVWWSFFVFPVWEFDFRLVWWFSCGLVVYTLWCVRATGGLVAFCVVWISLWLILWGLLACLFRVLLIVLYTSCLFLFVIIYFVVVLRVCWVVGCSVFVCLDFASVLLVM